MPAYPPQPWHLAGEACLSLWRVPVAELPRAPAEPRPLTVAGAAVVVTAWVDYQNGGELSYRELLAAVAVRDGVTAGSITEIWVDSAVSLAGGRQLWDIPKELATLDFSKGTTFTGSAATQDDWIATAAFSRRIGSPVRIPAACTITQPALAPTGPPNHSPVRVTGKPRGATSTWNINPEGPLGYLAGRRPVLSARLHDFRLRFGADQPRAEAR